MRRRVILASALARERRIVEPVEPVEPIEAGRSAYYKQMRSAARVTRDT